FYPFGGRPCLPDFRDGCVDRLGDDNVGGERLPVRNRLTSEDHEGRRNPFVNSNSHPVHERGSRWRAARIVAQERASRHGLWRESGATALKVPRTACQAASFSANGRVYAGDDDGSTSVA